MAKLTLSLGILSAVLGLVVYQFGLWIITRQINSLNQAFNVFLDVQSTELLGGFLQLLGGILILTGAIKAVSNVVTSKFENERQRLTAETLPSFEERISNLIARQVRSTQSQVPKTGLRCRYCDAELKGNTFCPACGKSQT